MANKRNRPRTQGRRRKTQRDMLPIVVVGAAVLIFGLLVFQAARPRPGMAMPDLGNLHIIYPETAVYNSTPPTSGPHYESLARWGIHTEPIVDELQVHNLEDGGVMVQYNCPEGCPELVSQLEDVVRRYPQYVILAPYPDMESRIALTAWQHIDRLEAFNERRIVRFIEAYRGIDHHQ